MNKTENLVYNKLKKEYNSFEIKRGRFGEPDFILPNKKIEVKSVSKVNSIIFSNKQRRFKDDPNIEFWIYKKEELLGKYSYNQIVELFYVYQLSPNIVSVTFEDEEFEKLVKVKGELTWRQFILRLLEVELKWKKK